MPTVRVTDAAIRKIISDAASGIRTELTDAATLGLKIRATRDGRAVWSIKLRDITGAQVRVTLGEYLTLGIADARREAALARHQVRHEGKNPSTEKRAARQKAGTAVDGTPAEITLTGLLDEFTRVVKHDSQTWQAYRRLIELLVCPLLDKPASSLTLADLQRGADSYPALGTASRAVAYLRPVLKWGPPVITSISKRPSSVRRAQADRACSNRWPLRLDPVLLFNFRWFCSHCRCCWI